jgi:hypothetical protein
MGEGHLAIVRDQPGKIFAPSGIAGRLFRRYAVQPGAGPRPERAVRGQADGQLVVDPDPTAVEGEVIAQTFRLGDSRQMKQMRHHGQATIWRIIGMAEAAFQAVIRMQVG